MTSPAPRTPPHAQAEFSFTSMAGADHCPRCGQPLRGVVLPEGLHVGKLQLLPWDEAQRIVKCFLRLCGGI